MKILLNINLLKVKIQLFLGVACWTICRGSNTRPTKTEEKILIAVKIDILC